MWKLSSSADISGSMASKLPAYFDIVFNMRILTKDDQDIRVLQTVSDSGYICKDRSNTLNRFEKPDLGLILERIKNEENDSRGNDVANAKGKTKAASGSEKVQGNSVGAIKSNRT